MYYVLSKHRVQRTRDVVVVVVDGLPPQGDLHIGVALENTHFIKQRRISTKQTTSNRLPTASDCLELISLLSSAGKTWHLKGGSVDEMTTLMIIGNFDGKVSGSAFRCLLSARSSPFWIIICVIVM